MRLSKAATKKKVCMAFIISPTAKLLCIFQERLLAVDLTKISSGQIDVCGVIRPQYYAISGLIPSRSQARSGQCRAGRSILPRMPATSKTGRKIVEAAGGHTGAGFRLSPEVQTCRRSAGNAFCLNADNPWRSEVVDLLQMTRYCSGSSGKGEQLRPNEKLPPEFGTGVQAQMLNNSGIDALLHVRVNESPVSPSSQW